MQYIISKFGNWGSIKPLPQGGLSATLDKYLQYEAQGKQFMAHPEWAIKHLYRTKTGVFPWGLIKLVERIMYAYCTKNNHNFNNTFNWNFEILEDINSSKLRDYQNEAVHALIKNKGGILCMPTGSGKTITIIEYLKIMNGKSLVVVPTLDIKKQWENHELYNLTVSTYQNPKLKDKKYLEQFNIICFDEAHHVSAKSLYNIAMKTHTNTILLGCSATIKREDGEDMKIQAALGEIVYEIPRKELIEKKWINNAKVYYLTPLFNTPMAVKFMNYAEVYNSQIINNNFRNKLIVDAAIKEATNNQKVLILVTQIDHGEKLLELFDEYETTKLNNHTIVFMTGKSKDRDRDMNQYSIIIATGIYDEGYDLPSLDCLILAAGGKSSIKLTQRIGRVLRLTPGKEPAHIYDFVDRIKYLNTHYVKRRKILESEFEIIDSEDKNGSLISN
jgi:superfamily II DNA or RNA helicase